jgi:hypothetical protein
MIGCEYANNKERKIISSLSYIKLNLVILEEEMYTNSFFDDIALIMIRSINISKSYYFMICQTYH